MLVGRGSRWWEHALGRPRPRRAHPFAENVRPLGSPSASKDTQRLSSELLCRYAQTAAQRPLDDETISRFKIATGATMASPERGSADRPFTASDNWSAALGLLRPTRAAATVPQTQHARASMIARLGLTASEKNAASDNGAAPSNTAAQKKAETKAEKKAAAQRRRRAVARLRAKETRMIERLLDVKDAVAAALERVSARDTYVPFPAPDLLSPTSSLAPPSAPTPGPASRQHLAQSVGISPSDGMPSPSPSRDSSGMPSPKADESDGMPSWLREARDALPATALPAPTPQTDDTAISGVISGAELSRLLEERRELQALLHEQHEVQQETLRQLHAAKEHAATEAQSALAAREASAALRHRLECAAAAIERLEHENALCELRLCEKQHSEAGAWAAAQEALVALDTARCENAALGEQLTSARMLLVGGLLGSAAATATGPLGAPIIGPSSEEASSAKELTRLVPDTAPPQLTSPLPAAGCSGRRAGLVIRLENAQNGANLGAGSLLTTTPSAKPGALLREKLAQLEAAINSKEKENHKELLFSP